MSDEVISQIAIEHLRESPFNPRKTFTAIGELAANIKAEGRVHSPLLVRPIVPPLFNAGADTQPEAVAGYEIVYGHRRFRAAAEAGLATVPCMVRAMSDAEARSAQIAENLARKDVHPIEEAEGFQAMIDNDGISADELAELVGKSKSYVYGRLKLLQAVPTVREACLRGEIGSEVALLVARVGGVKLQEKALHRIQAVGASMGDGGQASFRRIKAELAEHFTLELKGAMFDREDATLLPDAGVCSACPKRSGNSPLFEDLADGGHSRWKDEGKGEPNRCTDPDCWEAKTKAHLARKAAALEAEGKVVVSGAKARQAISAQGEVKGDFVELDAKLRAALKKANAKPQVQHIVNPRDSKVTQAVLHADLVAAGLMKAQAAGGKPKRESHEEQNRRYEQERKAREARAEAETKANLALLRAVRAHAAGRERTEFELRLVTAAALHGLQWNDRETLAELHGAKSFEQLAKRVDTLSAPELTTLLLDTAIIDNVKSSGYGGREDAPGPLLALASHYGLDAKAITAQASALETTSTPSPAGAGTKKAAPKGVKYLCADTGETWLGKGKRPAWLNAKIAGGGSLSDFEVAKAIKVKDKAGSAGGREAGTGGMFDAAEAVA